MNPQERRIKNRREKLRRWRAKKEYRDKVSELIKGKRCIWCGTDENLQIHHTGGEYDYRDYKTYLRALDDGWVMCRRCHIFGLHKGRILCPVCKKHYTANSDRCFHCLTPEEKKAIETKQEFWRNLKKKWARDQWRNYKQRLKG